MSPIDRSPWEGLGLSWESSPSRREGLANTPLCSQPLHCNTDLHSKLHVFGSLFMFSMGCRLTRTDLVNFLILAMLEVLVQRTWWFTTSISGTRDAKTLCDCVNRWGDAWCFSANPLCFLSYNVNYSIFSVNWFI